jgi:transposase
MVRETYLRQPEMVEFLLAENLALKSLLMEKGVLTPEEFKAHKEKAAAVLTGKVEAHVAAWKRTNPEMVSLYSEASLRARQEQGQVLSQTIRQDAAPPGAGHRTAS